MDVGDYLERIGVRRNLPPSPSAAQLAFLHRQHLLHVPFENLDIHRGVTVELEEKRIVEKLVSGRGGFCYELNSGFAWLLRRLGFAVQLLSAEVRNTNGEYGIPFDHMLLRVRLPEGDRVADVGFGDSFRTPLLLESDEESPELEPPPPYRYRLRRDSEHHYLERAEGAGGGLFEPRYRFTLDSRRLSDYRSGCRFHQTSAESPFTRQRMITLALERGRVTLMPDRLIHTLNGHRQEKPISDRGSWNRALKENFGLSLEMG